MNKSKLLVSFCALACALAMAACHKKAAPSLADLSPEQLVERGKSIYTGNCISCHNIDPRKDGSVGPMVAGASLLLLEARMIQGTYPPGYKPLRETHVMPVLPHLKAEIPALAAYLAEASKAAP